MKITDLVDLLNTVREKMDDDSLEIYHNGKRAFAQIQVIEERMGEKYHLELNLSNHPFEETIKF